MSLPCLCTRLRRATRSSLAHYDAALRLAGLTTPQYALLRAVQRIGPCSLSTLAEETTLDRTTLTRTLAPLEERRLILSGNGADRRCRELRLSEAGEAAIARALPLWENAQQDYAGRLGPEDAATLIALLERLETAA